MIGSKASRKTIAPDFRTQEGFEDDGRPPARARLDQTAQALIGAQLKAMYAEICEEPVPSELLDLVKKFEQSEVEK